MNLLDSIAMLEIKENYPLAPLTTFGVGGNAKYFVEAETTDDIIKAFQFAGEKKIPVFVMSGGSNILVSDYGFDGLVVVNKIKGFKSTKKDVQALVSVGAGENWGEFVKLAVENNWAGVELLSGIPGSVGGAPVQNIGAYGGEASQVIKEVFVYDLKDGKVKRLAKEECEFDYRKSIFNTKHPGRYVILEVVFELHVSGEPKLVYHDLKLHFEGKPKPSLKDVHLAVLEIRARKGMVIHPEYESFKSAGSFFKNPIISKEMFGKLKAKVGEGESKWFWPQPDGRTKVSAAKLIELAGFKKGFKMGNAGISPKHTLALINLGNAKAEDIVDLAKAIQEKVRKEFSVKLEPEVQFVGFEKNPLLV